MFSYFLFAPLFGWLADRVSRWKIIGVGVILWSLASGASGWASTFELLFLTRCAVGLGEAAYGPARRLSFPIFTQYRYAQGNGLVLRGHSGWQRPGYVLGGQVISNIHVEESWRWAFYLVMPRNPPGAVVFFMPEPRRGQSERAGVVERKATWADVSVLLRTPSYVLCSLGMTAMTFAMGGIAYCFLITGEGPFHG